MPDAYLAKMLLGIAAFICLVLIWDLWLYLKWGYWATISGVIQATRRRYWWVKIVALIIFIFLYWHWFG